MIARGSRPWTCLSLQSSMPLRLSPVVIKCYQLCMVHKSRQRYKSTPNNPFCYKRLSKTISPPSQPLNQVQQHNLS
ncbi:hypothetical protein CEXT_130341 [Caerostris extrusa]|uniref:Uncharacterized protein n=1 Tax=Caerostris extrusa TaxID=172846 RepID=A0AAV4PLL0_CAEEX|nr:hypothetical protein CEXT_130341 [Caerostris extrusa]